MKQVTNTTGVAITLTGQQIEPAQTYVLEAFEYDRWANSDAVLEAVASGAILVSNGVTDLSPTDGINLLKDITYTPATDYSQSKYGNVAAGTVDTDGLVVIPNGVTVGVFSFRGDSVGPENYVMLVFDYGGAGQKIIAVTRGSSSQVIDPLLVENQVTGNGSKTLGVVVVNDSSSTMPAVGGAFQAAII